MKDAASKPFKALELFDGGKLPLPKRKNLDMADRAISAPGVAPLLERFRFPDGKPLHTFPGIAPAKHADRS
ncbi:hypothetical protein [Mesorhizobium sp. 1M-11]|uniref:hypothetical protein n=1 Tax=Mesorhizobium sp. 1M-11 TaxID=1529006 RepID=UPI0006C75DB9|nr:hypothetical protein [Mesorhizobium sp. 1M-11]